MDRHMLPSAITGGYVTSYDVNLLDKAFRLEIEVLENGVAAEFDLMFEGLTQFEFSDRRANRWERIEVSDVIIDHGPEATADEEWLVRMSLWDIAVLVIRCAAIRVDGVLLR